MTFAGALPDGAIREYPVPGHSEACGTGTRELRRVDLRDGALLDAFVFLGDVPRGKPWPDRPQGYMLDQRDCRFIPRAQVVPRGPLLLRNSDEGILHTVNAQELVRSSSGRMLKKTIFNVAQPVVGTLSHELAPGGSPFVTIGCESHNFMTAQIMVPKHPYAVVVDEGGRFEIDDVPPGTYDLFSWHPFLGLRRTEVVVTAGGSATASFEYTGKPD